VVFILFLCYITITCRHTIVYDGKDCFSNTIQHIFKKSLKIPKGQSESVYAFCHVHTFLFAWLTDNIHHVSFIRLPHVLDVLLQHYFALDSVHFFSVLVKGLYQTEPYSLKYFKWCWIISPFDINSVVFHFDDFNYGRQSQPYFFLAIATQLVFFHNL
jgi:hypothetical protein